MRTARNNCATGLTLIELLVVISIITIIISAIVVASFSALKAGQVRGTRGVMQKIALALAQYKLDYGMYRPTMGADGSQYTSPEDSTYMLWEALEYDGKYLTTAEANKLRDTSGPAEAPNPRYKYIDAWKKSLWYQCPPLKYDLTGHAWVPEVGDFSRFRIISSGPDMETGNPDPADPLNERWGDNIVIE